MNCGERLLLAKENLNLHRIVTWVYLFEGLFQVSLVLEVPVFSEDSMQSAI